MLTWPCKVFRRSSRFLGFASTTGTKTGPCPIGRPVVSSKNCNRSVPASAGISSIFCCSLALSAASVRCLLLGGGITVAISENNSLRAEHEVQLLVMCRNSRGFEARRKLGKLNFLIFSALWSVHTRLSTFSPPLPSCNHPQHRLVENHSDGHSENLINILISSY